MKTPKQSHAEPVKTSESPKKRLGRPPSLEKTIRYDMKLSLKPAHLAAIKRYAELQNRTVSGFIVNVAIQACIAHGLLPQPAPTNSDAFTNALSGET
jgi:uncharacterized protein (DUF1778 family)